MSRSSVIVFVSRSAIFTLCRAKQIRWERHAHSPFCDEPGGNGGKNYFCHIYETRLSLGKTLKNLWQQRCYAHGKCKRCWAKRLCMYDNV